MQYLQGYPTPQEIKEIQATYGTNEANRVLEEAMITSAQLKAQETMEQVRSKKQYNNTDDGIHFIAKHIEELRDKFFALESSVMKNYLDVDHEDKYYTSKGRAEVIAYQTLVYIFEMIKAPRQTPQTRACSKLGYLVYKHLIDHVTKKLHSISLKELKGKEKTLVRNNRNKLLGVKFDDLADNSDLLEILGLSKTYGMDTKRINTGNKLLEAVLEQVGATFERRGNNGAYTIAFPEELIAQYQKSELDSMFNTCDYLPMLSEPRFRSSPQTVAYNNPILRAKVMTKKISKVPIPKTLVDAGNKVQKTPFRINGTVLKFLEYVLENDKQLKKFNEPVPEKIPAVEWPEADDPDFESKKAIWRDNKQRRDAREKEIEKKVAVNNSSRRAVEIARYYYELDLPFYLPVFFDSRGRIYYRSAINPQQSKPIKALFRMAEGAQLGNNYTEINGQKVTAQDFFYINYANTLKNIEFNISDNDLKKEIALRLDRHTRQKKAGYDA